ncbi:MAG: aminomethyl-transferring glycine dehydrogenase subunit GcvPB [Bdellovibrionota bacterium]
MTTASAANSGWPQASTLLKEQSKKGHEGFSLADSEFPEAEKIPTTLTRKHIPGLPELSELDVVRHFTRLSQLNYSIDSGMYPLGSCTMKYNPRINEVTGSHPLFARLHPLSPDSTVQGAMELMWNLESLLKEISGFERVSLIPAAGAQGEYTGLKLIRAYLKDKGIKNNKILIPDSAHGTNPATAAMCGFEVVSLKSNAEGLLDKEVVLKHCQEGDVAGIMLTNPNTLGLFEREIQTICEIVHDHGALVYCDGANMNAMLGLTRPGDAGVDVMHFNQHKTFTTPHGGGGPGCGAVGVCAKLIPYLPTPLLKKKDSSFAWEENSEKSIGPIKDFHGHFMMMLRSYTYIRELGAPGIQKIGRHAILLANYVRCRLGKSYEVAYPRPCMHEVVLSDKLQQKNKIKTLDIAKRLLDFGFHPPTVYFPLIVPGALMIEPTETETLATVEKFCAVMEQIAKEASEENAFDKYFKNSPKSLPFAKIDETKAARDLKLTWNN